MNQSCSKRNYAWVWLVWLQARGYIQSLPLKSKVPWKRMYQRADPKGEAARPCSLSVIQIKTCTRPSGWTELDTARAVHFPVDVNVSGYVGFTPSQGGSGTVVTGKSWQCVWSLGISPFGIVQQLYAVSVLYVCVRVCAAPDLLDKMFIGIELTLASHISEWCVPCVCVCVCSSGPVGQDADVQPQQEN